MVRLATCVLLIGFALPSCNGDDLPGTDAPGIIIGRTFGQCADNCVTLFLIRGGEVYPGKRANPRTSGTYKWAFAKTPLDDVDAALVDSLVTLAPEGLDQLPSAAFGCPDCGDWGALPLWFVDAEGKVIEEYTLDNATTNMATSLQAYGALMQRAISGWEQ